MVISAAAERIAQVQAGREHESDQLTFMLHAIQYWITLTIWMSLFSWGAGMETYTLRNI